MGFGFRGNLKPVYVFLKKKKKKATLHLIFSNEILKVYVREVKIEQRKALQTRGVGGGGGGFC